MNKKWKYYFGEAINNITKTHKVMSVISILTIALSMFVFNFLFVGLLNLNHISKNMASQITISAYFNNSLNRNDTLSVSNKIQELSTCFDSEEYNNMLFAKNENRNFGLKCKIDINPSYIENWQNYGICKYK